MTSESVTYIIGAINDDLSINLGLIGSGHTMD